MPESIPSETHHVSSEYQNGLYTQSRKLLFESPSQAPLESLGKADSRVTYFHYRVPDLPSGKLISEAEEYAPKYNIPDEPNMTFPIPDIQLEGLDMGNREGIPRNLFNWELVIPHLRQYLAEKYRGREIAIRGTACTIRVESCIIGGKDIKNPVQILQMGVERSGSGRDDSYAPMTGFDANNPEIGHRSVQWLTQHPEELRDEARKEGRHDLAASIFPILIIYDRTKFPAQSTTLPSDPTERSKSILEAVVLDYPLSRQEFREQSK